MKKNFYSIKKPKWGLIALFMTFCCLFGNTASAQTVFPTNYIWMGSISNSFGTAGNWTNTGRYVHSANYTSGSTTITIATPNLIAAPSTVLAVGHAIVGPGIPAGTTVIAPLPASFVNGAVINISAATTTAGTGAIVQTHLKSSFIQSTYVIAPDMTAIPPKVLSVTGTTNMTIDYGANVVLTGNATISTIVIRNIPTTLTAGTLPTPATATTLTINPGANLTISGTSATPVILAGGDIVNNGALNITSTSTGASAGITCAVPNVVPASPTIYSYSGVGNLNIDLSASITANSAAVNVTSLNQLTTYRVNFNEATTNLTLGATATSFAYRSAGGALISPLIIGGTGVTIGKSGPATGGLISVGGQASVTVNAGTVLTMNSLASNVSPGVTAGSGPITAPTVFTNNGTINILGQTTRSGLAFATFAGTTNTTPQINIVNNSILNVDIDCSGVGQSALNIGNGGGIAPSIGTAINITNAALASMTLKNTSAVSGAGFSIFCASAGETGFLFLTNNGTLDIIGTVYNYGPKATITNNSVINTNNELRSFTAITNNAAGSINFNKTATTALSRLVTFGGLSFGVGLNTTIARAGVGTIYQDTAGNQFTVVIQKFTGFANTLTTSVLSTTNMTTIPASGILTRVSGSDLNSNATIAYGDVAAVPAALPNPAIDAVAGVSFPVLNGALRSNTTNSGTINTALGSDLNNISGLIDNTATGVIAPGGAGYGVADLGNVNALPLAGTLRLQVDGTTIGTNCDQVSNSFGGSGYTTAPTITFVGGGGSGATASVTLTATSIASLLVTNTGLYTTAAPTVAFGTTSGGTGAIANTTLTPTTLGSITVSASTATVNGGYTGVPAVTIAGGGGSGATADAIIDTVSGRVTAINITNAGSGYTSAPTVSLLGGGFTHPATATALLTPTPIATLTLTNGGSGYTSAPGVTLNGGGPLTSATATATAVLTPTSVNTITLSGGGLNYLNAPVVTFSSTAGGSGAAATATVASGIVTTITKTASGSGYTSVPSVSFSSGASGAEATATVLDGVVTGYTITNGGSGYSSASLTSSAPSVVLSGGGGSGAAAAVTVSGGVVTAINTVLSLSSLNLDLASLYTPEIDVTVPIVTTSGAGTITGGFLATTGLESGWSVVNNGTAKRVELVYDWVLPTALSVCKDTTIGTIIGNSTMKFYTLITGGTLVAPTTKLTSNKNYFVTETPVGGIESARSAITITVNGLPATPSLLVSNPLTESKNICKYIGTSTPVIFDATAAGAVSYLWTAPGTAQVVSGSTTSSAGISFLNASTVAGPIGSVIVRSVDNVTGCISLPKALALTTKAPTAPTTLVMTSLDSTPTFNGAAIIPATIPPTFNIVGLNSLSKITKVGPDMGTSTVFTLTAQEATTAASYKWTLPTGVNPIASATVVNAGSGIATSTTPVITVNFANVPAGIGTLPIIVQSVGGCGLSSNRVLTLARVVPGTPKGLVLTSLNSTPRFSYKDPLTGITSLDGLDVLTKITKVGPYQSTTIGFTLTVTPFMTQGGTATSYAWILPAGVVCTTTPNTPTTVQHKVQTGITPEGAPIFEIQAVAAIKTTTSTINILFNTTGTGNLDLLAFGVNGAGNSVAKKLVVLRSLPTAPTKLVLTDNVISTIVPVTKVGPYVGRTTVLTLTGTPFTTQGAEGRKFYWTLPAGVNVLSGVIESELITPPVTDVNGNKTWTSAFTSSLSPTPSTAGMLLTVNLAGILPGVFSIPLSVKSQSEAGTSATSRALNLTAVLPTAPTKLVLTDGATIVTTAGAYTSKTTPLTLTATPITTQGDTTFSWVLPAGVNVTGGATNVTTPVTDGSGNRTWTSTAPVLTIDLNGIGLGVVSIPMTVIAVNGVGNSTPRLLTVKAAAPATPGAITTPTLAVPTYNAACPGTTFITVQVPSVFGVSYNWNVGTVATITSGQGTNSIVINVEDVTTATLAISVIASNGTGSSAPKAITIKKVTTCREANNTIAEDFNVIAYPNPSSSEFTIEASRKGATNVKVYDMTGRLIENRQENAKSLQVGSKLAAGAYNVIVKQGANTKTLRVIKK